MSCLSSDSNNGMTDLNEFLVIIVGAAVTCPLEVVKTRLQVKITNTHSLHHFEFNLKKKK